MSEAVLLLAYGGPDSLDDVPAYLTDIRRGRPTPPHLLEEITRRYVLIGGRSPLLDITQQTAVRLSEAVRLPVYVGMRHWHPTIAETVAQMAAKGVRRCTAICMAPHYSQMSIGAYRTTLENSLAATDNHIAVAFVESWHTEPAYLDGVALNVRVTLDRFSPSERDQVQIIFTAHSLPASILEAGDPYDRQFAETARLVAARLGIPEMRWSRCYQSAAQTGTPWLGPQIEELVPRLAAEGHCVLLVAPIGFVADHVEVLYDLDIGLQAIAGTCGARVERTPMLNASPLLIDALTGLVRKHAPQTPAHDRHI
jgi:ferrochelatase